MPEDNVIDFATEKIRRGDHMVRGTAADGLIRAIPTPCNDRAANCPLASQICRPKVENNGGENS